MTVPSTVRRAGPFTGNGVTTSFSFSFKTFAATDLQVTKTDTAGVETTLIKDSDYSVTLNGDQDASPGGTITYPISGSPLPTGEQLTVIGALPYEQTTDLLGGGAFNARVIEDTFDRAVIQIQQLEERLDRALTLPVGSTANSTTPLPQAANLLAWNAGGDGLQNIDPADLLTVAGSTGFDYVTRSGDATTTLFLIGKNPGTLGNLEVFISGVRQTPGIDYTIPINTIPYVEFTSAPPFGTDNILIRWAVTYGVGVVATGSVGPDKLTQPYTQIVNSTTPPGGWSFTSNIPTWAKRFTISFYGVLLSGSSSNIEVTIGTSGLWQTTGYYSGSEKWSGSSSVSTVAFIIRLSSIYPLYGKMVIEKVDGFNYVATHSCHIPSPPSGISLVRGSGHVALTSELRRLRIQTPADTFTSGTVALSYE